jgi:hypothetical protein
MLQSFVPSNVGAGTTSQLIMPLCRVHIVSGNCCSDALFRLGVVEEIVNKIFESNIDRYANKLSFSYRK